MTLTHTTSAKKKPAENTLTITPATGENTDSIAKELSASKSQNNEKMTKEEADTQDFENFSDELLKELVKTAEAIEARFALLPNNGIELQASMDYQLLQMRAFDIQVERNVGEKTIKIQDLHQDIKDLEKQLVLEVAEKSPASPEKKKLSITGILQFLKTKIQKTWFSKNKEEVGAEIHDNQFQSEPAEIAKEELHADAVNSELPVVEIPQVTQIAEDPQNSGETIVEEPVTIAPQDQIASEGTPQLPNSWRALTAPHFFDTEDEDVHLHSAPTGAKKTLSKAKKPKGAAKKPKSPSKPPAKKTISKPLAKSPSKKVNKPAKKIKGLSEGKP